MKDKNASTRKKEYKEMYDIIEQGVDGRLTTMLQSTLDGNESEYEDADVSERDESRKELATIQRNIRVLSEVDNRSPAVSPRALTSPRKSKKILERRILGDVSCWLVDGSFLLVIATANSAMTFPSTVNKVNSDNGNNDEVFIQADADIPLADLAAMKFKTVDELLHNPDLLVSLAKEIIELVDISISKGESRLILSLGALGETEGPVEALLMSSRSHHSRNDDKRASAEAVDNDGDRDSYTEDTFSKSLDPLQVSQEDLVKMVTGSCNSHSL